MFLIDKYRVTNKFDLHFRHHKEIYGKLFGESCEGYCNMPNLLIHGAAGSGKKTLINIILMELYGNHVMNTRKEEYSITGYGNSNIDVEIEQSDYHLVIEPNNSGFDKYLIQEIVTEYAKRQSQFVTSKAPFKIVVINNVDNLSYYAQTSLRCTMERYQKNCKFILCSYQISKIIDPLRSRCLDVRVPKPSIQDITATLFHIAFNEDFVISPKVYRKIIKECNRDVKAAIWMLEMYRFRMKDFSLGWKHTTQRILNIIHQLYVKKKGITINDIIDCRLILNNILISNVTGTEIMIHLLDSIIMYQPSYPNGVLEKIIEKFSEYDNKLSKGKRCIIHLEGLLIGLFHLVIEDENRV